MSKWTSEAGPIQTKAVQKAAGAISDAAGAITEVNGVHDGRTAEDVIADYRASGGRDADGSRSFRVSYIRRFPMAAERAALAREKADEVGEAFAWKITRANYSQVAAAFLAAAKAIPACVSDERITPEEKAAQEARSAGYEAERAAAEAVNAAVVQAVRAKAPGWAKALIVAEEREDRSDAMTDYFSSATLRTVAIGWRSGSREDFRQLRAAAAAYLGAERGAALTEHRDNYSMGQGNYLSDHGWAGSGSGWVIRSRGIGESYLRLSEDAIPATTPTEGCERAAEAVEVGGVTIRPSTQRDGYVEVLFPSKPDEAVRSELKASGFRWALRSACWYGPAARLPERYGPATV